MDFREFKERCNGSKFFGCQQERVAGGGFEPPTFGFLQHRLRRAVACQSGSWKNRRSMHLGQGD